MAILPDFTATLLQHQRDMLPNHRGAGSRLAQQAGPGPSRLPVDRQDAGRFRFMYQVTVLLCFNRGVGVWGQYLEVVRGNKGQVFKISVHCVFQVILCQQKWGEGKEP